MTISEYEAYMEAIDDVEERIIDNNEFPVIKDYKIKRCCMHTLELTKFIITFIRYKIDATKKENQS